MNLKKIRFLRVKMIIKMFLMWIMLMMIFYLNWHINLMRKFNIILKCLKIEIIIIITNSRKFNIILIFMMIKVNN